MPTIKKNITIVNRYVGGNKKLWLVIHNVGTQLTKEGSAYANSINDCFINQS